MNKNHKIKAIILGGGINSAVGSAHIASLKLLGEKIEIIAACFSRNKKINEETLQLLSGEPVLYEDIVSLVEDNRNRAQLAIVLTPTNVHYENVSLCLSKGLNVICEKALVSSVDHAEKLRSIVSSSKKKLFVVYNYLGYPIIYELKKIINNGMLGDVFNVQIEMPQQGYLKQIKDEPVTPQKWRLEENSSISMLSLDLGVHLHILIKHLLNVKPIRVIGIEKSNGNFYPVIDDVNALIEFENNIVCNMWFSKSALGHRNGKRIRIYGSKGSIEWTQTNPEQLIYSDITGSSKLIDRDNFLFSEEIMHDKRYCYFKPGHPIGFVEALKNFYVEAIEALSGRFSFIDYGLEESIEGLKLFEALKESFKKEKWIKLN